MIHYLIDSGHSGVAFGRFYKTPGKRSPKVPPGIYEGEFDRGVSELVVQVLEENFRIPAEHLTPGPMWPRLAARAEYTNWLAACLKKEGNELVAVSIHANADGNGGWTDTNFSRIFHAPRASSDSVQLARNVTEAFRDRLGYTRPPGVLNTTMLTKTTCPAILVECGHMTHKDTAEVMSTGTGKLMYAYLIAEELARWPN